MRVQDLVVSSGDAGRARAAQPPPQTQTQMQTQTQAKTQRSQTAPPTNPASSSVSAASSSSSSSSSCSSSAGAATAVTLASTPASTPTPTPTPTQMQVQAQAQDEPLPTDDWCALHTAAPTTVHCLTVHGAGGGGKGLLQDQRCIVEIGSQGTGVIEADLDLDRAAGGGSQHRGGAAEPSVVASLKVMRIELGSFAPSC